MNEKAGSRDLDDADIIDVDNDGDAFILSDDEAVKKSESVPVSKAVSVKSEKGVGPIARHPPANRVATRPKSNTQNASQELLANLSKALDPRARAVRSEEHSVNALQSQQIFSLTSQLREAQRQLDAVRRELADAERQRNNAERRADRAEVLNMIAKSRSTSRSC